jgi:hypothetical protein
MLKGEVTEGCQVQAGAGQEAFENAGPVLRPSAELVTPDIKDVFTPKA